MLLAFSDLNHLGYIDLRTGDMFGNKRDRLPHNIFLGKQSPPDVPTP